MAEARREWVAAQPSLDPASLVFLDETWAATNMARRYGRAPRGQRALDAVPHGHWKTTTVVAALRADGIAAPLVLDGAINGESFLAYVRQFLAPALRPGDVLVMDNLPSHKVAGVREAIEAAGATLRYLPPYSPDLNPVRGTAPNAGLRQAQGPAEVRGGPHRRGAVGRHRPPPRALSASRVRPLSRPLRLRTVRVIRL